MARYHINPETGNPGVCRAKVRCRFGNEGQHFGNEDDARAAYENEMHARTREDVKNYGTSVNSTVMHTDITEGGTQAIVILETLGVETDDISSPEDLGRAISRLPDSTQNIDELREVSAKLYQLTPEQQETAIDKIKKAKILAKAVKADIKNEGFSDEEIVSKLRWMGKEDPPKTVGDVGVDDYETSLKAGSPALKNRGHTIGSKLMGYSDGTGVLIAPEVMKINEQMLNIATARLLDLIGEGGGEYRAEVGGKKRTWRIEKNGDGETVTVGENMSSGVTRVGVPLSAMKSMEEWEKLTSAEQQIISKIITSEEKYLKENTEYGTLLEERREHIAKTMAENFSAMVPESQKEALGSFLGITDKACTYISINDNDEIAVRKIPSLNDFMNDDSKKIHAVTPRGEGIVVTIANENDKSYSNLYIRGRYTDGQLAKGGRKITSEQKGESSIPDDIRFELASLGYKPEKVYNSLFASKK